MERPRLEPEVVLHASCKYDGGDRWKARVYDQFGEFVWEHDGGYGGPSEATAAAVAWTRDESFSRIRWRLRVAWRCVRAAARGHIDSDLAEWLG